MTSKSVTEEPQVPAKPIAESPWEDALNASIAHMRRDSLRAAVVQLKQGMLAATSERERFHWQLAQARLCHAGRHYELAAYQLEALQQLLHESRIDRWEPDLTIAVLQLLADSYQRMGRKHTDTERRNAIYQRLCHLDLEAALDQTPGS